MYILNAKRIIFFHNPKTAGRSTIVGLGFPEDNGLKLSHLTPDVARKCIFQESWKSYYSFSFVRNPWDRMVSLYEYHRSLEYGIFQRMNSSHALARSYTFDEWILINHKRLKRSNWFGVPQSDWTRGVSKVFRFEDYVSATQELLNILGEPRSIEHLNKSVRRGYAEYYLREETVDIVRSIDIDTISTFDYRF